MIDGCGHGWMVGLSPDMETAPTDVFKELEQVLFHVRDTSNLNG